MKNRVTYVPYAPEGEEMKAYAASVVFILISVAFVPINGASGQQSSCSVAPDQGANSTQVEIVDAGGYGIFDDEFDEDWGLGYGEFDLNPLTEDVYAEVLVPTDDAMALRMELVKGYRYRFCVTYYLDPTEISDGSPPIGDVYLLADTDFEIYKMDYDTRFDGMGEALDSIPLEWRDMATWLPFRDVHAYERVQQIEFTTSIDSDQTAYINWWGPAPDANMYLVLDNWNSSRSGNQPHEGMGLIAEVTVEVEERVMLPAITAYALVCLPLILLIIVPAVLHSRFHGWKDGNESKEEYGRSMPLVEGDAGGEWSRKDESQEVAQE